MNKSLETRKIPYGKWVAVILVVALICILFGFMVLGIARAREHARRTQSANNLKQLALGIHNFHDTQKKFPPGGTVDPNGKPLFGWTTSVLPYLEASPLYSYIDLEFAWDDPINHHVFRFPHRGYQSPIVPIEFSSTGFGLAHYTANQDMFGINRKVCFQDLSGESSHTWMIQELYSRWQPWGSAHNFCELNWPTDHFQEKVGWSDGGLLLGMADGSVTFLDKETADEQIDSLRFHSAQINPEPIHVSKPRYQYDGPKWSHEIVKLPSRQYGYSYIEMVKNQKGIDGYVYVLTRTSSQLTKADRRIDSTLFELERAIQLQPKMSSLKIRIALDAEVAEGLSQLNDLQDLVIGDYALSSEEASLLQQLPSLKSLTCRCSEAEQQYLNKVLPEVVVRNHSR